MAGDCWSAGKKKKNISVKDRDIYNINLLLNFIVCSNAGVV